MDIKDIFNKAEATIKNELEVVADKEIEAELRLKLKQIDLYRQTTEFKEYGYRQLIKAIEADHIIKGEKVSCTHTSKDEEHVLNIKCTECGATTFNVLDKDYIEIYEKYSYCLECAMCGKRKWYKLDNVVFEEVRKTEDEEVIGETYEDYEEEIKCEQ